VHFWMPEAQSLKLTAHAQKMVSRKNCDTHSLGPRTVWGLTDVHGSKDRKHFFAFISKIGHRIYFIFL
jgi:hypothetical protein